MALMRRRPQSSVLHHSDRGSVYASQEYLRAMRTHDLVGSMSRKGDCYDNAVSESFFSTLKNELIWERRFASPEEARKEIFKYIEVFYNRQRIHQTLGYQTPEQIEESAVS